MGRPCEPVERLAIDVPETIWESSRSCSALRKGRLEQMVNHGTGWVRMEYLVPARGLIGFRTEFLTETRGPGFSTTSSIATSRGTASSAPAQPASLVADRRGPTTTHALLNLQERGAMFVGPASMSTRA